MKREKILEKAQELAVKTFGENVAVFSNAYIYPLCWVGTIDKVYDYGDGDVMKTCGKRISPQMKPTELCAYLNGYLAGKEAKA